MRTEGAAQSVLVNEPAEARFTTVTAERRAEGGVRLLAPGTARSGEC